MKKERVLSICAVLALLALSLLPATPLVLAYSITVDGNPSDWTMAAPPYANLGHIVRDASQQGEYIWRDVGGDERTDFTGGSPDTRVDLTEFRVTGDASNLYFLACMTDIDLATGNGAPQVQVAIDTDQVTSSGEPYLANLSDTQVNAEAEWEYLVYTRFGSGSATVGVWQNGFGTEVFVGSEAIDDTNECAEFAVPWASLGGGPPTSPLRFTAATFRANASDQTWDISGVSDALDCVTNYGDPGDTSSNAWTDIGDGVVDYFLDLFFETDGDIYPPLLISEVLYDPSGSEPEAEFIEIYNASPISIDLAPCKVGDEETIGAGEGMEQFPSGSIASGGVIVLAYNADTFNTTYGFLPDYAVNAGGQSVSTTSNYATWASGNIGLTNTGDEVILLDGSDTAIDVVEYADSTPEWTGMSNTNYNVSAGQSMQRTPANVDTNDISADFVAQSNDGTPGSIPTAVELVSFSATPRRSGIRLDWETATELDNVGFNFYRAESLEGERLRLNPSLIPGQAPGSPVGAEYTWLDETAQPGITYYYWLEDVDLYGRTTPHGPVPATVKPRLRPAPAQRIAPGLAPEAP